MRLSPFLSLSVLLAIVSLLEFASVSTAHSTGADSAACASGSQSQLPGHGFSFQSSASPYRVNIGSTTTWTSGTPISVTLESTDGSTYLGFLISVFKSSDTTGVTRMGSFQQIANTQPLCSSGALTHSAPTTKQSIVFNYNPPAAGSGSLYFQATVVREYSTFWKLPAVTITEAVGPPSNPTGVAISNIATQANGLTSLTISWTAVSPIGDINYYIIERMNNNDPTATFGNAVQVNVPATSTSLTDLPASTTFVFRVRSHSQAGGNGPITGTTNRASATTNPTPVSSSSSSSSSSTGAGASSAASSSSTGAASPASGGSSSTGSGSAASSASSSTGAAVAPTIPNNPTSLTISNAALQSDGTTTLTVTFTAPSPRGDIDSFYLDRSSDNGQTFSQGQTITGTAATSYSTTITQLPASTTFTFRARSHSPSTGFGSDADTNNLVTTTSLSPVPITPVVNATVAATILTTSGGVITLDLTAFKAAQTGTVLTGFDVQYRTETGTYGNATFVAASANSISFSGLTAGKYYFRVRAKSSGGDSAYSAEYLATASTVCLNNCNGQGTCRMPDKTCDCNIGFVGEDCSIASKLASPLCFGNNCAYRLDYGVSQAPAGSVPSIMYFRLRVATAGWAGILLDSSDGMSGGNGYQFLYLPSSTTGAAGTPSARAIHASIQDTPSTGSFSSVDNLHAWQDTSYTEYTFSRSIAATPVIQYSSLNGQQFSWAYGASTSFTQHADNARGRVVINWLTGTSTGFDSVDYIRYYASMVALVLALVIGGAVLNISGIQYSGLGRLLFQKRLGTWKGDNGEGLINFATFDAVPTIVDFLFVEVLLIASYAVCMIIFIVMGYKAFDKAGISGVYVWGHAAAMHYAFVLFPVQKNSILNVILGTSFERMQKYHRFLGRIAVIYTYIHMITQLVLQGTDIIPNRYDIRWGLYALCSFSLTCAVGYEGIRRRFYKFFIIVHVIFAPLGFIFGMLHVKYMYYYVPLPLFLWVVDLALRFVLRPSVQYETKVISAQAMGNNTEESAITKLTLDVKGFPRDYEPGSYCFLHVSNASLNQVHPFSISNYPSVQEKESSRLTFHILDMARDGAFTHALRNLVQNNANAAQALNVRVDGPYGKLQVDLHRFRTIVLMAGGIGVTPFLGILDYLVQQINAGNEQFKGLARIHFIWTCRSNAAFQTWAPELLAKVHAMRQIITCHFFFTSPHPAASSSSNVTKAVSDIELASPSPTTPVESSIGDRAVKVHISPAVFDSEASPESVVPSVGRPNIAQLLQTVQQDLAGVKVTDLPEAHVASQSGQVSHSVAVLACGPAAFIASAQEQADVNGFYFHKETFLL